MIGYLPWLTKTMIASVLMPPSVRMPLQGIAMIQSLLIAYLVAHIARLLMAAEACTQQELVDWNLDGET